MARKLLTVLRNGGQRLRRNAPLLRIFTLTNFLGKRAQIELQDHRHTDQNRLLIMPRKQRQFLVVIDWLFAAAGNITNAVSKAGSMGRWAVYFIICLCPRYTIDNLRFCKLIATQVDPFLCYIITFNTDYRLVWLKTSNISYDQNHSPFQIWINFLKRSTVKMDQARSLNSLIYVKSLCKS